ncbi:conjugal transfer protein TrbF [Thalassospira profundimaris]|uniref:Conjugal transfer protein TrbF n=1 Tax=Thalassospira profundimaris TaxID=502049 RepID=A0A367WV09_9PROT|nr:conjugal transfer protein TrbF [Thalassospira profundimaris]RCK45306.1 conjugal transfer protein TrbF [Thalassospira profundimaris]
MMFKRPTTTYGDTPEPVTPYQKAAQVWDERIGSARVQARNWRFMAFGCLALAIGLSGGVVWQAGRSTITPYVVEIDTLGQARAVGPAIAAYEPTDAQIAYHLARFIENVRSLSIDPIVVRQNWLRAYDYATDRAANTLNDYARENDPFSRVGQRTVTVEVTSIVRSSDDSFELRWREQSFENGVLADTTRYTAVLSIVLQRPRNEEALRKNPLGIYVHALNWSRDLISGDTP